MKKHVISLILIVLVFHAAAQSPYDAVLAEVESNSTRLNTLRKQVDAQKLSNRTGIFLNNPEVEFGMSWGKPSESGTKKELSVAQSFDFPTAYLYKSKIANMENLSQEMAYRAQRMELMLSVKRICIGLVYCNAMEKEYFKRFGNAKLIAQAYNVSLEKGDANIIEVNKAALALLFVQNRLSKIELEKQELLSELRGLNGGKDFEFELSEYVLQELPADFEQWYSVAEAGNPLLESLRMETDIAQRKVKLDRAMTLPKISAGYAMEKTLGEEFRGFTVGVSIPLWENRNTVRASKAQLKVIEAEAEDTKIQLYNQLRNLHSKALRFERRSMELRNALATSNNETLLLKALEMGEMPLLDYIVETEFHYDAVEQALEAERDYELAAAELSAFELLETVLIF